jgi:prepilin-type N-terminal cleavage/methylation domain-containing protein
MQLRVRGEYDDHAAMQKYTPPGGVAGGDAESADMHVLIRSARGFTLIELAVGLAVVALLLGSVLVPLTTQVENRKIDETQRILAQARDALLGYVAANGYFPCPADVNSNGAEALGAGAHDSITGSCAASTGTTSGYHGFLPSAALGVSPVDAQGYAIDAWGYTSNRIRYAIFTDSGTVGTSLVRSGGMANLGIPTLGGATLFNICLSGTGVGAADCGSPLPAGQVILATNAAVVIWSLGPRSAGGSVHETENLDNDRVFVSRSRSDVTASQFDDIVTWVPMSVVISRLIAAGQLP